MSQLSRQSPTMRLLTAFPGWLGLVWAVATILTLARYYDELKGLHGFHVSRFTWIGRDFVNMWFGGRLLLQGQLSLIYDLPAYAQALVTRTSVGGFYNFSYPPHMLMVTPLFGATQYPVALAGWTLGSLALFWWAARPWLRDAGLPSWAALILPGVMANVWAGHFGALIGALTLLGWRAVADAKPRVAGAWFALATVKPHVGVLMPLVLLARRHVQTIAWAALFTGLLVLLSVVLLGRESWHDWVTSTLSYQMALIDRTSTRAVPALYPAMMPTVTRAALTLGASPGVAAVAQGLVAVAVAASLLWLASKRALADRDLAMLAIAGTAAALPYVFLYDLPAQSLVALLWTARRVSWIDGAIAGAAFLVPSAQLFMALAGYNLTALASVALYGRMAWVLAREPRA